jgi:predicted nucleic acid-binding protein
MFLDCAQAAKADYLVTGNTDHFPKGRWKYRRDEPMHTYSLTRRGGRRVWYNV